MSIRKNKLTGINPTINVNGLYNPVIRQTLALGDIAQR
jgi:hypothetical protein